MKNEKLLDGLNNRVDTAKEKIKEPKCGTRESIQTEEKEKWPRKTHRASVVLWIF